MHKLAVVQTVSILLYNTYCVRLSISTALAEVSGIHAHCTCTYQRTGTSIQIPICSPFLRFRQLYKSPLDLDSAIYSVGVGKVTRITPIKARRQFSAFCYSLLRCVVGLPPGRRQLSEMGEKSGKDKIFGI